MTWKNLTPLLPCAVKVVRNTAIWDTTRLWKNQSKSRKEEKAVAQSCGKKLFWKILESSQKVVCGRVLIVMLQTHIFQR